MAITNVQDIEKAISNYIGTYWTTTTIINPNDEKDVSALTAFIDWHIVYFNPRRITITGTAGIGITYPGQIVIGIYVKPDVGTGVIKSYIDDMYDLFCEQQITISSTYTMMCKVPEIHHVGKDGAWWKETIRVPFEYIR